MSFRPTGKDPKERQPDDENRVWKVELEPDSCYPIIWLLTKYIASPQQFAALMPYIQEMLTNAEPEDVEPVRQKIEFEPPKQVPQHTANATPASDCGTCGKNISW